MRILSQAEQFPWRVASGDDYQIHLVNAGPSLRGSGMVAAYPKGVTPGGSNWASALAWDRRGKITNVDTKPAHRGRGLATSLYQHVLDNYRPDLMHDHALSPDGKGWAAAVGGMPFSSEEYDRRGAQLDEESRLPWEQRQQLDAERGWPSFSDGIRVRMADLYHFTPNADSIYRDQKFKGRDPNAYFTTNPDSGYCKAFGSGQVHLNVPDDVLAQIGQHDDNGDFGDEKFWAIPKRHIRPEWFVASRRTAMPDIEAGRIEDYRDERHRQEIELEHILSNPAEKAIWQENGGQVITLKDWLAHTKMGPGEQEASQAERDPDFVHVPWAGSDYTPPW